MQTLRVFNRKLCVTIVKYFLHFYSRFLLTTSSTKQSNTTEPNFVGSFEIGEYVYFFFRESAVEYINCGKSIYSRVARVCKVSFLKKSATSFYQNPRKYKITSIERAIMQSDKLDDELLLTYYQQLACQDRNLSNLTYIC